MIIRRILKDEAEEAAALYVTARKYMREAGNIEQWNSIYPSVEDVLSDIENGTSYVCEDEGEIVAVFHFHIGPDKTYGKIYDGAWKNGDEYGVIHRIAVKYHGRRIADFIYSECFKLCGNLKIDTHKDNLPMQRSLSKNGFEYCGIIHLPDGSPRMAYQKTR